MQLFSPFPGTYSLLIAQKSDNSHILRYNGSHFNFLVDTSTLPSDTAGGQLITRGPAQAAAHLAFPGDKQFVVVGVYKTGEFAPALLLPARSEAVKGLGGPVGLVVSDVNQRVWVASKLSRSIAAFTLDEATGSLVYLEGSSVLTNWTRTFRCPLLVAVLSPGLMMACLVPQAAHALQFALNLVPTYPARRPTLLTKSASSMQK